MISSIPRIRWRMGNLLIISILIILGLLFLIVSLFITNDFWQSFCNQLATVLLVAGVWTGIYEMFLRLDFIRITDENSDRVISHLKLSDEFRKLGLDEARADSGGYDFTHLLLHSEELFVVLNTGRTWVSTHSDPLRRRFQDADKKTTVFLLHPDSSMLTVISRKEATPVEGVREKIAEAVQMLNQLKTDDTQLAIYGHHLYNPYSLFLGDAFAVITPYYVSIGRRTVPLFTYLGVETDSYYRNLREDVTTLLHDAQDISTYKGPLSTRAGPAEKHNTNQSDANKSVQATK